MSILFHITKFHCNCCTIIFINCDKLHIAEENWAIVFLGYWVTINKITLSSLNPLHPNIIVYILHTVL